MIYLIRHTTPDIDSGICYGQTDLDVSNSFEKELVAVQQKIDLNPNFKIYSSPLIRCAKLARALAPDHKIIHNDQLKEIHFGQWELQRWNDIPKADLDAWGQDFVNHTPPNGENLQQLNDRVARFWHSLNHTAEDHLIVAHAGVIRCLLGILLEIPLTKVFSIDLDYGAVIKVNFFSDKYHKVRFL